MSRRGRRFIAKLRDERGVTLLELVIAQAIVGLLLPVIAAGLVLVTQKWHLATERIEAREQVVTLVRRVEAEVQAGRNFAADKDSLLFQDASGRWIRYVVTSGGMVMREELGIGSMVIGAKVSACRFEVEDNGRLVRMRVTAQVGKATSEADGTWYGRGREQ